MHDTWEATNSSLRAINKLFVLLHDSKPKKDSPEEKVWEAELKEVRAWAISVHYRRIAILLKERKDETHHRNSIR